MPVEIEIADNSYLVEADSLSTSLRAGIAGPQLDFRLIPGQGFPPMQKPVSISLGVLSFEGILNDDNRDSANTHIAPRTYSAVGKHVFLNRDVDVSYRGLTSVADLADDLVFPTGMAFSVVGDTRNIQSFAFKGNLTQALQYLAVKGKYMLHFGLAGIELVDKLNPPAAPFNWIYQSTSGWRKIPKRFSSEIPYNKIFVEGGVPKLLPDDPDEEEIEVAYVGNGIQTRFKYPRKTDEIFDVTLDGESLTICQEGDPLQASFDCFNDRGETEVVFNTPPGEGIEIILFCRIQRALGMWENTALQSEFSSAFGGDGKLIYRESRPEIRTQAEADEYAESLGLLFGQIRKEYSAEVWGNGIFYPGRAVLVNDSRDGINDTLLVQQTQLTYKSHLGRWLQQVTVGNGADGDVSGSATAYVQAVGGRGFGNQITTKQPPTETSQAMANLPKFLAPYDIVRGEDGMYYLGDGNVIRSLDVANNILDTYAGNGSSDVTGDGGLATSAGLGSVVRSIGMDQYFNLYLFSSNYTVRKIDYSTKIITTFAGNGTEGNTGNGGASIAAQLVNVSDIIERPSTGEILIGQGQYPIRRVNPSTGIIEEFVTLNVGNGEGALSIIHIGADTYICTDITSRKIYQFDSLGNITHLAGTGGDGYTGDGGLATDAEIGSPWGIIGDGSGNYYFSDYSNSVVRKIDSSGIISTVAGTGTIGYSGNNGPGTSADLCTPIGLELYLDGDLCLLICDSGNACIRKLNLTSGLISLFAGTPQVPGYSGDGGPLK